MDDERLAVRVKEGEKMKYTGMAGGMWLLFHRSFREKMVTVLEYSKAAAAETERKALPKYKEIIAGLPEFEKADRFKMNIVNCAMLAAFYSANLDLPEEVGSTMDLELGVEFVGKVLDGEITDGKKLQAFLDKGSKSSHLTTTEGQRVMAQFEKAIDKKDNSVRNVKIEANALAPKNPRATLPQGETKKLHDFVADLVMNEDNTEYDKSLDTGKLTGRRLRMLVVKNKEDMLKVDNML